MKYCVLTSGSKGNCTYIEINNKKYLIDAGTNFLYISNKLKEIDIDIKDIEGIFITHCHDDHTSALKRIIKVVHPIIYITEKTKKELKIDLNNYILLEENNIINNINVKTIKLSHDVADCRGYIFEYNNKSLVYITDTGYINVKYNDYLYNKNAYIIESNHDVEMLMNSSRPYFLKMRILGDEGHISNKDCSYYLKQFVGNETKNIVLAHLSENNNTQELALEEISKNNFKCDINIALQNERTEVFNI